MNRRTKTLVAYGIFAMLMASTGAVAQIAPGQISGSDGSDGAISITEGGGCISPVIPCADLGGGNYQLTLPDDGRLNVTSFSTGPNTTVAFVKNARNTPVRILSIGRVTIDGVLDLSATIGLDTTPGAGGPGGFDGGLRSENGEGGTAGYGPGAGNYLRGASHASDGGTIGGQVGARYGTAQQVPILGGSGGGGNTAHAGGGGGGAILIASDYIDTSGAQTAAIEINGTITVKGATSGQPSSNNITGHGSGGSIRLVGAIVSGTGTLNASGGNTQNGWYGGGGWIRFDVVDASRVASLTVQQDFSPVSSSVGQFLKATLDTEPLLNIVRVGDPAVTQLFIDGVLSPGAAIPAGETGSVEVFLDFDAPMLQEVVVQPSGFPGDFCLDVTAVPAQGLRFSCEECPVLVSGNQETTVTVSFPLNTRTQVSAWSVPCP